MKSFFNNEYLIFFIGLFLGLVFIILPVIEFSFTHFPGDFGDGRLNLYFLEHSYKFLTFQLDNSYWDAPFMYPTKQMLTYSDNLLGSAPIYGLFRLLGLNIFTSYQWWFIIVAAMNYFSAYFFLKHLTKSKHAAALGAMVFAFSLALSSQLAHAQTFPRFAIPLALLFAAKFHDSLSSKDFFWMTFFVVYQIYCGIYLGFLLLIPFIIFTGFTFFNRFSALLKKIKSRHWLVKTLFGLCFNGALLSWLIYPYLLHSKESGGEPYEVVHKTLPTFQSYLLTGKGTLLWDYLSTIGLSVQNRWDFEIFPGAVALIGFMVYLMIIFVKKIKRIEISPVLWGLTFSAVVTFFLFLKIGDKSLYYFVYLLPGFSAMRSMARIINVELIFFGLGIASVTAYLFSKYDNRKFLIFVTLACLITVDNYSNYEFASRRTKHEAQNMYMPLKYCMNKLPEGSIVSFEPTKLANDAIYYHISAMLASQNNNIITVNGYSGSCPHEYSRHWHKANKESRNYWLSTIDELKFDTLYVIDESCNTSAFSQKEIIKQIKDPIEIESDWEIEKMIIYIKSDPKWMNQIREKAKSSNITVDSVLHLDAVWMINQKMKKSK